MSYVYLAGKIDGLTFGEANGWREHAAKILESEGIKPLNPLRGKSHLMNDGTITAELLSVRVENGDVICSPNGITHRDFADVMRSDAVLANCLGLTSPSIGTDMELSASWFCRKPLVVVSEQGGIYRNHSMVRGVATYIVDTLAEALDLIRIMLCV